MARERDGKVSIAEVAKRAGVSLATASRALNDAPNVHPATRQAVRRAARQLGYVLSERRPGPKPGRPVRRKELALVHFLDRYHLHSEASSIMKELLKGIAQAARDAKVRVSVYEVDHEATLPLEAKRPGISGYLLKGQRPHPETETYLKTKPCCWVTNNPWTPSWGDHILPDHRDAGMKAADYLIRHGCRTLTMVTGCVPDRVSALREEGFRYGAAKHRQKIRSLMPKGPLAEGVEGFPERVYLEQLVDTFRRRAEGSDGIFFDTDRTLGTMVPLLLKEKLIEEGRTVLIGCNNQQSYLKGFCPHPATMEVHCDQIGRMGVAQLLWRIRNRDCKRVRSVVAPTLISLD